MASPKGLGKGLGALLGDFDAVLSLELVQTADKRRAEKEEAERLAREEAMKDPLVAEILTLIDQRAAAKKAKNFAEADRIRDYLLSKGVTLIDSREGTTYQINMSEEIWKTKRKRTPKRCFCTLFSVC